MLYCKGALAEMLRSCTHYRASEADMTVRPLDQAGIDTIKKLGESLAAEGLRVLAVAEKRMEIPQEEVAGGKMVLPTVAEESNMTMIGFLTFMDTPKVSDRRVHVSRTTFVWWMRLRELKSVCCVLFSFSDVVQPSAAGALSDLARLGVQTKVLTGDNPLVAKQVCNQLGIDSTHVLTGDDMTRLSNDDDDPELLPLFRRTTIFSQLSPDDKARVVRVLREGGATVAALGDGINDALMLREADVGISVDTGADLAKEAADVILTEKDLHVLVTAVSLGRRTHGNSIKYIKMAASSNFGNCQFPTAQQQLQLGENAFAIQSRVLTFQVHLFSLLCCLFRLFVDGRCCLVALPSRGNLAAVGSGIAVRYQSVGHPLRPHGQRLVEEATSMVRRQPRHVHDVHRAHFVRVRHRHVHHCLLLVWTVEPARRTRGQTVSNHVVHGGTHHAVPHRSLHSHGAYSIHSEPRPPSHVYHVARDREFRSGPSVDHPAG
jgi:phosphoserine phosphatase